jgi:6-pyruvoyltetrahydropterin/6-carboxytetrahydropterin synthase
MSTIRVTKEFLFEMAHALWNYDGPCSSIHGHSYRLLVTISGTPIPDPEHPKYGMVMDFGDLKSIVKEEIVDRFDHAIVLSRAVPKESYEHMGPMFRYLKVVDYQPTCENLLIDFQRLIKNRLPSHIQLVSLRLHETPTSYAEWFYSDNE